eukprot:TRINITY_DN98182_c0_g1_i1.p1 TRINITY_DN98182_c0_g1~~TRINITY_DN98182_c0_g1_i1.p1  ORF type:complete len:107 (-),score=8.37 TRINITY_DN98182_c0_g1_i1:51-371(-)
MEGGEPNACQTQHIRKKISYVFDGRTAEIWNCKSAVSSVLRECALRLHSVFAKPGMQAAETAAIEPIATCMRGQNAREDMGALSKLRVAKCDKVLSSLTKYTATHY